jgi:chaperonin GroES
MLKLDKYLKLDDKLHEAPDLSGRFEEIDLRRIGLVVRQGYDEDRRSRASWEDRMKAAMDLAMQVVEEKSYPWPNAANVAFPLVTIGALQFHSRAYPTLVSGKEVVKVREAYEEDELKLEQARLAVRQMNLQLLQDSPWEEETDRGLLHLAIIGSLFKYTYFSSQADDVVSELVFAKDLVLDYYAKSVETCRRKSHCLEIHKNTLLEGMRLDKPKYRRVEDKDWFKVPQRQEEPREERERDGATPSPDSDTVVPFDCIAQHCWLDLDNDGYEEPYIVTIDLGSNEVLRLVARWDRPEDVARNARGQVVRITATEHFTQYVFIPSPDGSVYGAGLGSLIGPLNESTNTIINQLLDAGTMSTVGGGFLGKGAKIRGGTYSFRPGEWKRVDATGDDLRKNIVPLDPREPSAVLFNLLNLLIQYTNRISGAMETMAGENPGQNTPKSNMDSMIEQGMKIYAAIFKRIWRSMKEEFRKIYIMNSLYARAKYRRLFMGDPRLCAPVADPEVSSEAERRTRAMLIAERASTVPGYNPQAVEHNLLRAMKVENPEQFYVGVDPNAKPPEDPRVTVAAIRSQGEQAKLAQDWKKFLVELQNDQELRHAEMLATLAEAERALAQAADARDNKSIVAMQTALGALKLRDESISKKVGHMIKLAEIESEPERKQVSTEPIRRLALSSGNGGAGPALPPEGSVPEDAMG